MSDVSCHWRPSGPDGRGMGAPKWVDVKLNPDPECGVVAECKRDPSVTG